MNCQPIKDILRYHKIAMPYTPREQEKIQNTLFLSVLHDHTSVLGVSSKDWNCRI